MTVGGVEIINISVKLPWYYCILMRATKNKSSEKINVKIPNVYDVVYRGIELILSGVTFYSGIYQREKLNTGGNKIDPSFTCSMALHTLKNFVRLLTPWLVKPEGSIPHSQGLSIIPILSPNQHSSSYSSLIL